MYKGVFIVLDGLDGSGKSSMAKMIHPYLSSKGYNALLTSEPTSGKYGKQIRKILAKDKNPKDNAEKLLELFVKDRETHLSKRIIPFLNKGKKNMVICDRYYYSTIAFQSIQGVNVNLIIEKNKEFLKPDIAFIMDIKPEIALDRIRSRKKEKFEQLEFMKRLREKFLELPEILEDNIKVIDSSKSQKEIFEEIIREIENVLSLVRY